MNKQFLRVKDFPQLARDPISGAIINVDNEAYKQHKKKKKVLEQKLLKEKSQEERINTLENDIKELKQGIVEIINVLKGNNGNS